MTAQAFLDQLERAADSAADSERRFRRESAEAVRRLERERAFSYRRLNLMRAVAQGMRGAEDQESALAGAMAVFRSKLGWSHEEGDAKSKVCGQFASVAQTLFETLTAAEEFPTRDVAAALADFEAWYASTHATPFWILFEQHMPDTPSVDF